MSGPARILRFTEILDLPDSFLRRHLKSLMLVAIPGTLLSSIPGLYNNWFTLSQPGVQPVDTAALAMIYGGAAVGGTAALVAWLALVRTIAVLMDGGTVGVGRAYLFAIHPLRVLTVLLVSVTTMIGCCLCIAPGVAVGIMLTILIPVMAHELVGPVKSISRSISLVTYRPPGEGLVASPAVQVLGLWLLFYLLSSALNGFQMVPLIIAGAAEQWRIVTDPASGGASPLFLAVITAGTFVGVVFTSVLWAYMGTCCVLLYRNVRYRREAIDLDLALDERLAAAGATAAVDARRADASADSADPAGE